MIVRIPGFPTEVSDPIELPDIGELLMYPAFQSISADDFVKHATCFQRYLLGRIPLRNDRKNVIVRCGVWLLEPGTGSHVDAVGEWHFDADPRVFVLSSPSSALTEFNANPIAVDSNEGETRKELGKRINRTPTRFGIVARKIEPCRVYTFEDHLHRAVSPSRIEFRFFLRVKETDELPQLTTPLKQLFLRKAGKPERLNIDYSSDKVSIHVPLALRARKGITAAPQAQRGPKIARDQDSTHTPKPMARNP